MHAHPPPTIHQPSAPSPHARTHTLTGRTCLSTRTRPPSLCCRDMKVTSAGDLVIVDQFVGVLGCIKASTAATWSTFWLAAPAPRLCVWRPTSLAHAHATAALCRTSAYAWSTAPPRSFQRWPATLPALVVQAAGTRATEGPPYRQISKAPTASHSSVAALPNTSLPTHPTSGSGWCATASWVLCFTIPPCLILYLASPWMRAVCTPRLEEPLARWEKQQQHAWAAARAALAELG